MGKQKFAFFWGQFINNDKPYVAPVCGSDGIMRVDGRWNFDTIDNKVREHARRLRRRDIVGYSIGNLECHDPDNIHCQKYQPFIPILLGKKVAIITTNMARKTPEVTITLSDKKKTFDIKYEDKLSTEHSLIKDGYTLYYDELL